jgi:hypothetical protein
MSRRAGRRPPKNKTMPGDGTHRPRHATTDAKALEHIEPVNGSRPVRAKVVISFEQPANQLQLRCRAAVPKGYVKFKTETGGIDVSHQGSICFWILPTTSLRLPLKVMKVSSQSGTPKSCSAWTGGGARGGRVGALGRRRPPQICLYFSPRLGECGRGCEEPSRMNQI